MQAAEKVNFRWCLQSVVAVQIVDDIDSIEGQRSLSLGQSFGEFLDLFQAGRPADLLLLLPLIAWMNGQDYELVAS